MGKFLKNWAVAFVVLFALDLVWHLLLFGKFYEASLIGTQRYDAAGKLAPLIPFVVLSDVLVSFGYAYLVTKAAQASGKYVVSGLVMGLVLIGSYTIVNHAILPNWPLKVVLVDVLEGAVFGAVTGWVLGKINRRASDLPVSQ